MVLLKCRPRIAMTASDRSKAKSQISCALLLSVSLALCLLAHKMQTRLQQPIGKPQTAAEQDWPFEFNLSTLHMSNSATAIQTASSHKQCSAQVRTQLHCGGAQADSHSYLGTQTGLPRTHITAPRFCRDSNAKYTDKSKLPLPTLSARRPRQPAMAFLSPRHSTTLHSTASHCTPITPLVPLAWRRPTARLSVNCRRSPTSDVQAPHLAVQASIPARCTPLPACT